MSVQDHTLRSLASLHRSVHARAAASAGDEYARLVSQGSVSRDAPVSGPTAHALVRGLWSALLKSSSSAEDQQGENENELDGQPSLVASAAAHTLVSLSLGRACLDPRKLALAFSALLANDHLIYNNNIVAVVVRAIAQLSLAIAAPETSPQLNLASRNPLAIALANALSLHVSSAIVVEACALLDTLELSSSSDGLTNLNHAAILATVVPVIALISAPETPPSVATALARRSATLVASSEPSLEARTVIASTLLRVVASMPPMMDAPFDLDAYAILETVLSFSAAYPDTNMHQQVVITILVFLVDSNIHRASILAYLNLFRKYVKTSVLSPALLTVTFVSFLHLLFSGSDLDRERIGIINILDSLFEPGPLVVPCAIVAAAVFPLTSLVSELPAKGNATLRKSAFLLLERVRTRLLTHKKDFTDSDVNEITVEQVFLTVSTYSSGFLISVIAQTIAFLDAWRNAKLALTFASQPSTLTPLLAPSFLLHPSESICLSAVTKLSSLVTSFTASSNSGTTSLPSTQLALPLLPFLLHLLTVPNSPTMTNALLQDLLPALATDAHATAAILRALAPLVDGAGGGATRAAGLRALHGVWRAQPRAWGTLKAALGKMVGTRRERDDRRRRFGKKGDGVGDSGLGDVDVEVAVAVTVWDVCRWKPKGHGQEMLPLALAMFEFQDALSITTALALEVVNVCVQLDITDPRAMWNVHHAAFVTQLGKGGFEGRELLWEKIMAFFALVPAKSEDTEAYQTFKLDIMTTYVLPLTENASLPSRVRSAALGALSAFSPPDLYPYLPPPPEFIPTLVQAPSVGATSLITSLAHHEILNMRRAVFKALAADAGVGRHALDESDDAEKALQRTRRVLRDIASDLRGTWVAGKTGAAVRASLATVALHVPASLCERESGTMLARLQVFKDLVNGLRDVSVTDHAIVRVEAVCLWISFWTQRLSAFGDAAAGSAERVGQVEWLFLAALEELEKRLREAKQPVPCANVLFALTGLVSAAATLGLPSANEHTTRIIRILLQQYARVSVDRASLSELQKSDEVQFGVSLSLGYLSRLLFPTDEESFGAILAQLMSELSLLNDDAQSPFAAGYVLNIVLQVLVQSPSPIVPLINSLVKTIFSPIAKGGGALQTNALIGLSMGASACLSDVREYIESAEDDEQVTGAIRTVLERFGVDSEATVIGDCWIIAAATVVGMVPEPHNLVSKLDKIVEKALVESSFAPALTHARFARNRILVALGQSGAVTSTLLETMASLSKTASNIPSVDKVSRVLSLMPILGLHPGIAYAPRIATFREIAEFFHKQVTTQDPKIARVMGWVLGKMFAAFDPLYDPAAAAAIGQGLGSSNAFTNSRRKDPSDYRRLNEGSSFLRASFDALSSLTARGITPDTLDSVRMLVSVLVNVGTHPTQPLGLPVVNWIKILNVCWESGDAVLLRDSFLLAAIHASATSAKSLVDFFVARLTSFEGVLQFAFRPEGVGKLLTLGGICERGEVRGDDEDAGNAAAAARIVVAPSKVLEIVQAMVTFVYDKVDHSATDHMIEFAETVQKALLLDITGAPASVMKLREEVLDLICGAFTSFPSEARSTKAILAVRRLTKTALTSRSEASKNILQALLSSDLWTDKTLWSLLHVLEFADSGHEHDWIVAAIKKSFVNKDHLFVSVLQFVFAQDPATTTCYDAACTYLRHVVRTSTPNTANERTIFRLSWIVRYLDVLIIACASHNGASVDAGWARGLSNLFSLLDAQFSVDAIEVMRVMEADWSVMASHVEVALPREVVKSFRFTDKEIATLRSQVAKRLLRLLECTIKAEDLVKQNKASTVRVVIASSTRSGIHNALMRMRDVEEVEEAWLNLVG